MQLALECCAVEKSRFHVAAEAGHKFPMSEAAHAADVDLPVLQKWLQRGLVHIGDEGSGSGIERKMTAVEVWRLALASVLLQGRLSVEDATGMARRLTTRRFQDGPWFFCQWSGIIEPPEGTKWPATRDDRCHDILSREQVDKLLESPDTRDLRVIPLRALDETISERLQELYDHEARAKSRARHG